MTESIAIRLTPTQMSLIWPGLDFIVKAYANWREKKRSTYQYPFGLYPPPPNFDRGVYDADMMAEVTSLWRQLRPKATSESRVRMNAIEVRIAILAVRVNVGIRRLVRRSGRRRNADSKRRMKIDLESMEALQRRSKRAICSLERHMKRANRVLRALLTPEQSGALMEVWNRHLRWMRVHLVYFKPWRPVSNGRKTRQQKTLNILMEMAARGLRNEQYESPNEIELRRMMRLYARSSRRAREGIAVMDMLRDPGSFSNTRYLALFVLQRVELRRLP